MIKLSFKCPENDDESVDWEHPWHLSISRSDSDKVANAFISYDNDTIYVNLAINQNLESNIKGYQCFYDIMLVLLSSLGLNSLNVSEIEFYS